MEITCAQVSEELLACFQRLKLSMLEFAEMHHLTPMQLLALHAMAEGDGDATMGRLAQAMHCDASNVTGIVDRLEAQGFIRRTECPQDRRTKLVDLTAQGKKLVDELKEALPVRLGCDKLAASERKTLHSLVSKLAR